MNPSAAPRVAPAAPPSWEFGVSIAAHVTVLGLLVGVARCTPSNRVDPIDVSEVMMIESLGPAPMTTAMPQRAERAPEPIRATPTPDAPPTPPPPNPSDLAFETPEAPKVDGDPDAAARREALLAEARRKQLIANMGAPIGAEDRAATAAGATGDGSAETVIGTGDPETARWKQKVKEAVSANWHPLVALCVQEPRLEAHVRFAVDMGGRQTEEAKVARSSGNASFDASALRAATMTGALPPPPAKYADAGGVTSTMVFKASECR